MNAALDDRLESTELLKDFTTKHNTFANDKTSTQKAVAHSLDLLETFYEHMALLEKLADKFNSPDFPAKDMLAILPGPEKQEEQNPIASSDDDILQTSQRQQHKNQESAMPFS